MFKGKIKKINIIAIMLMALFFVSGCLNGQFASSMIAADGFKTPLTIKVLDIGQGDAILIHHGDKYSMIDTADIDKREDIVRLLKKENVKKIENLIITHPHADHLGGAWAIMNNFSVARVYDDGVIYNSNTYKTYIKTMKKYKIPRTTLKADSELDFGEGIKFITYAPGRKYIKNERGKLDANNNSIVGKLVYGEFSMMFTGDAEKEEERQIASKYKDKLQSKILKVGHHGSKTSSTTEFLKYVKPEVAVISVGLDNKYHHPHTVALKRLKESLRAVHRNEDLDKYIYRTDEQGTIAISAKKDGHFSITTEREYTKNTSGTNSSNILNTKREELETYKNKALKNVKPKDIVKYIDKFEKNVKKEIKNVKEKSTSESFVEIDPNIDVNFESNEGLEKLKKGIGESIDKSIKKNLRDIEKLDKEYKEVS